MIARLHRQIGQAGFVFVVLGLGGGTLLFLLDHTAISRRVLTATLVLLIVLPVLNVVAALLEELLLRDWLHVAFGCGVLALLGVAILR